MSQFSHVQKDFLESLFTKLNNTINDKTSEIRKEIKVRIDELKEQVKDSLSELETKIKVLEVENKKLTDATLKLERKVRKNNIAIFGVGDKPDLTQAVRDIFINNLEVEITAEDINHIYRIGNSRNSRSPLVVEFISYQKKLDILKNTKKLKGLNISITSDLCSEDRKDRKILVKHLKEARKKGAAAYLKGGKLYVSGEVYSVRDLEREVESEEEEFAYKDLQDSEIHSRPSSAPTTPDPVTRGKRQLEEEESKENQNIKKKSKEAGGSNSGKTKSSSPAIKTRSNSQKS